MVACDSGKKTKVESKGNANGLANVNIGEPLYAAKPYPKSAPAADMDAVVIPGNLTLIDKVDVPSQRDGQLLLICRELRPGEKPPPDRLVAHPYRKSESYYELRAGDLVEKGDMLGIVDDREAQADVDARSAVLKGSQAEREAAVEMLAATRTVLDKYRLLGNSISQLELLKAEIDVKRSESELKAKEAGVIKAQAELARGNILLDLYRIRSPISGRLRPPYRDKGGAVKALEPVFHVQNQDRLRVEGSVDRAQALQLKDGSEVDIEPAMPQFQNASHRGHLAVNGVAVTYHNREPMIVSVDDERYLRVWNGSKLVDSRLHPVSVRSVACTAPASKKHWCLTGSADGKGRLWDLTVKDAAPRELEGAKHDGMINCVALSPNGEFCATADDRDIIVWSVETGKVKYKLPQLHRGVITSLSFTPQCKLISAASDNTLRVWSLGTAGAKPDLTYEGRSGDVPYLTHSHDGGRVAIDYGSGVRIVNINEQRIESVLQSPIEGKKLSTFAVFSPDDQMILTTGSVEGRISLWFAPGGTSRFAEYRQLTPRERAATFTCVTFCPHPGGAYVAAGTREGSLIFWTLPTADDLRSRMKARLTYVEKSTDVSANRVKLWAEFDNPKDETRQLLPGSQVTIVAYPKP
jgi:WD40 repeat protein